MAETFELTNYNFYSSRLDMKLISNIVDTLKEILEEDKKEEQPLFLKVADDFIMNIARKVVQEKKKTFLIGITGESASGKTVFVDNTIEAVVRDKKEDGEQLSSLDLLREHRGDNDGDDKPHDMRERHFQTHKKGLPERKVGERFPEVRKRIPADRCDVHAVHVAEHGHDGNTYGNRRKKQETKERNGGKRRSAHLLLPAESAIFA